MVSRFGISRTSFCVFAFCLLLTLTVGGCTDNYASSGSDQSGGDGDDQLPQHLPDADLKLLDWVGKDVDEPFDVKGFLESRAAPADNAAPLYLKALAEISTDMYLTDPPPSWEWNEKDIPERVRELDKAVREMGDSDKLLAGEFSVSEMEAVLKKAKPTIEKLDEVQRKPHCLFDTDLRIETYLQHAQASRDICRLAYIQLCHARLTGNYEEAEQALKRTLRLSRDLRPRGVMVIQLVSCILDNLVSKLADFTLAQPGMDVQKCDKLLSVLQEHEREAIAIVDEALKVEYVMMRNTLYDLQHGHMDYKSFAKALEINNPAPHFFQRLEHANWRAEIAALKTVITKSFAVASLPYYQAQNDSYDDDIKKIIEAPDVYALRMFLPSLMPFLEAAARRQTRIAAAECLIAVRRYELQHGKLPADLATATSEAGLKKVPIDPYSGKPMLYKVIDGKPVVYSIGKDGKDDGGEIDWKYGQQPGDFIFRIRE